MQRVDDRRQNSDNKNDSGVSEQSPCRLRIPPYLTKTRLFDDCCPRGSTRSQRGYARGREHTIFSAILVSKRTDGSAASRGRTVDRSLFYNSSLLSSSPLYLPVSFPPSLPLSLSLPFLAHLETHTMTRAHSPLTHTREREREGALARARARVSEDTPSHSHTIYIHAHAPLFRSSAGTPSLRFA